MEIDNVQFEVDAEEMIQELQVQLHANNIPLLKDISDTGDNIMVTCPYHKNGQERKPSAGILKADGTFHCLACGETHTLAEVISHCFGKDGSGIWGWQWLIRNYITVQIEDRKLIELDLSRKPKSITKKEYVSESELDSYRYYHPYMWKRKMNREVVEIFDVGFDTNTNCITFPVKDTKGNTLFIARRSVNSKYFNYPSGAEKPVYGIHELHTLDKFPTEVVVCESMIDALTVWAYGGYAVALNGLGTNLQFDQLNKLPCRKLILATDNDVAGMSARKRIKKYVNRKLITEYILPSDKKDINDLSYEEFKNLQEVF